LEPDDLDRRDYGILLHVQLLLAYRNNVSKGVFQRA